MLPVYIDKRLLPTLNDTVGIWQNFLNTCMEKDLNKIALELLLNDLRIVMNTNDIFYVLKSITLSIKNQRSLIDKLLMTFKSNIESNIVKYYNNRLPKMSRNIAGQLDSLIFGRNYLEELNYDSEETINKEELEKLLNLANFSTLPRLTVNIDGKMRETLLFVPIELNEKYLILNPNSTISTNSYFKAYVELVNKYSKDMNSSQHLKHEDITLRNPKNERIITDKILKDYYNFLSINSLT